MQGKLQDDLGIDVRAAFVGYSKNFICTNPELTYNCLGNKEVKRSYTLKKDVEEQKRHNYKYFDLIECVPPERRSKEHIYKGEKYILVEKEDFLRNAEMIRKHLLGY